MEIDAYKKGNLDEDAKLTKKLKDDEIHTLKAQIKEISLKQGARPEDRQTTKLVDNKRQEIAYLKKQIAELKDSINLTQEQ